MPVDLEPLLPSPDAALDVEDTLYEKRSRRGLWYGLLTTCLLVALGLQLAWQHREELLARYPVLEALCEHVTCRPSVIRAPERFRILQRDIKPTANEPDSLTLTASFRNVASIAQVLPDIQLSLLDTDGSVLIRRRLSPADYLYPAPADQAVVAPRRSNHYRCRFQGSRLRRHGFHHRFSVAPDWSAAALAPTSFPRNIATPDDPQTGMKAGTVQTNRTARSCRQVDVFRFTTQQVYRGLPDSAHRRSSTR